MDENVFRISRKPVMAKALLEMAEERLQDIKEESKPYKIIEQYYEIIKELITSLMYLKGFKTLSHKLLIEYLEKNYKNSFDRSEFILIDDLRRLRNDILYYGKKVDVMFLRNKQSEIRLVVNKLLRVCKEEQRKGEC
ncbi:hypothetical protein ACFL0X_01920 [Nanoarchaeota archaeon]